MTPASHVVSPKADVTVKGMYTSGEMKAEVYGVAKISEEGIVCWTPDGKRSKDLEDRLTTGLLSFPRGVTIPFMYGKKNRIVIVLLEHPRKSAASKPQARLGVFSIGSDLTLPVAPLGIRLSSPPRKATAPPQEYEFRAVAVDKSVTTTTLRLTQTEPLPEVKEIDCKEGATASIGGQIYKISRILKGVRSMYFMGLDTKRPAWTVVFDRSGTKGGLVTTSISAKDQEGRTISMVDKDGVPSFRHDNSYPATSGPDYFTEVMGPSRSEPRRVVTILFISPEKIGKLVLTGSRTKTIDITGIPLEPKK